MRKTFALVLVGLLAFPIFSVFAQQTKATNSLVGYWKFDENSGAIAHDSSGNGNDGIIHTATRMRGKVGDALHFNGVDSWVEIPNSPSLTAFSQITLEAWILEDSIPSRPNGIISKCDGAAPPMNAEYFLGTVDAGRVFFETDNGVAIFSQTSDQLITETGKWYHVAGTWSGDTYAIYVNGQQVLSGPCTPRTTRSNTLPVQIGRHGSWPWVYFNGKIDEVKIYNYARTTEQIMQDQFVNPCSIRLLPAAASNSIGTSHTVTAVVADDLQNPLYFVPINFTVTSGPNKGLKSSGMSNAQGQVTFTWSSIKAGTDVVEANTTGTSGQIKASATITWNKVSYYWVGTVAAGQFAVPLRYQGTDKTTAQLVNGKKLIVTAIMAKSDSSSTPCLIAEVYVEGQCATWVRQESLQFTCQSDTVYATVLVPIQIGTRCEYATIELSWNTMPPTYTTDQTTTILNNNYACMNIYSGSYTFAQAYATASLWNTCFYGYSYDALVAQGSIGVDFG